MYGTYDMYEGALYFILTQIWCSQEEEFESFHFCGRVTTCDDHLDPTKEHQYVAGTF